MRRAGLQNAVMCPSWLIGKGRNRKDGRFTKRRTPDLCCLLLLIRVGSLFKISAMRAELRNVVAVLQKKEAGSAKSGKGRWILLLALPSRFESPFNDSMASRSFLNKL
jgi:hypothetical protein